MAKDVDLGKWMQDLGENLNDAIQESAELIANEGDELVREFISERDLGTTWSHTRYKNGVPRSGSENGRVWTGQMRDDIDSEVDMKSDDVAVASFGWINNYQSYYGQQEVGFRHEETNRKIEGMFAMHDAADLMDKRAEEIIERKLRGL